ncbi:hypothetical protein JOD43_001933 [Pullulanibacillus pueri]|nr:hypothetical protein [Pullulanibacillus pueri]
MSNAKGSEDNNSNKNLAQHSSDERPKTGEEKPPMTHEEKPVQTSNLGSPKHDDPTSSKPEDHDHGRQVQPEADSDHEALTTEEKDAGYPAIHTADQNHEDEPSDEAVDQTREFNPNELAAAMGTGALPGDIGTGTLSQSQPVETRTAKREGLKQTENGENGEEEAATRQKRRKALRKEKKQLKVRAFPIWLRLVLLIVLAFVALAVGAMIGYGVIGKGNPMDVFHVDTWKHIKDLVTKGT